MSASALNEAARPIGLLSRGIIIADSFRELTLAFDLAVFGQRPGRSRAIDRYARAAKFPPHSVEGVTLEAMRDTFRTLVVKNRHQTAGVVVEDLARQEELWLMDEGVEMLVYEGTIFAARLIPLDSLLRRRGRDCAIERGDFRRGPAFPWALGAASWVVIVSMTPAFPNPSMPPPSSTAQ
jgi:hypothetical protein